MRSFHSTGSPDNLERNRAMQSNSSLGDVSFHVTLLKGEIRAESHQDFMKTYTSEKKKKIILPKNNAQVAFVFMTQIHQV